MHDEGAKLWVIVKFNDVMSKTFLLLGLKVRGAKSGYFSKTARDLSFQVFHPVETASIWKYPKICRERLWVFAGTHSNNRAKKDL